MLKTRIRDLREDRDYSQKYIASIIGVKQNTYSDYENGKLNLPIEALLKLSDFYETSVDYILFKTDETTPYPVPSK